MTDEERLLRDSHASLAIRFGTSAPYLLGPLRLEKVGFAGIPVLTVPASVRERDIPALVPVCRQAAFAYFAERGVANDALTFRPSVAVGKERQQVAPRGRVAPPVVAVPSAE